MFMSFEICGLDIYLRIGRSFEISLRQHGIVYGMCAQKIKGVRMLNQPYGFFRNSYGNSPLSSEYGVRKSALPYGDRSHLLTSHLSDLQWHPACKLPSLLVHLQQQLVHVQNQSSAWGRGWQCIGVGLRMRNIGCALEFNTERLPKILKIFTRNTDSTVNGLRALSKHNIVATTA